MGWLRAMLGAYGRTTGLSLMRQQMMLLGVAIALWALQWILQGEAHLLSTMIYTLLAGNVVTFTMSLTVPLHQNQPLVRAWIIYMALLLPVAVFASAVGGVIDRLALHKSLGSLADLRQGDIPFATLVCLMIGVIVHVFSRNRAHLQRANSQLSQQVQYGQQELAARDSELRDAFEIQSSLLPRTVPQIAGAEISCAWQPARTVSGDYFDVVRLSETRIAFCLADVSGKGMSAALITANLQATLRAFVQDEGSPARLCHRLNQALCASLPTGRFVTLVYAIFDRKTMTLTYEVAGHNPPMLLRGAEVTPLEGSGPVLGILSQATFADQAVQLRSGDRVVISTDGITEAFSAAGEEFGEERLVLAAGAAGQTAHATRTEIMRVVTEFAEGNFHDDASLVVLRVEA